jgi:hypothetical protein
MRRFVWAGNAMAEIGAVMAGEGVLGSSPPTRLLVQTLRLTDTARQM